MNLASIFGFLKVWWPILSFAISLVSGIHAAGAHANATNHVDGADSISAQATHVLGVGALSGLAMLAGASGVVSNHRSAASAPSVAPNGVDPVLHQLDVCHSAMIAAQSSDKEFDGLNELIKLRGNRNKPAMKAIP